MSAMSEIDVTRQILAEDPAGTVRHVDACERCLDAIDADRFNASDVQRQHLATLAHVWEGWTLARVPGVVGPHAWTADPCSVCRNPWASIGRTLISATRQAVAS